MKGLFGAAFVAGALAVVVSAAISPAAAAPQAKAPSVGTTDATDFGARRHVRRHYRHHGYSRPFTTTIDRSTIGRIPIHHRRRSPSVLGLVRHCGERVVTS